MQETRKYLHALNDSGDIVHVNNAIKGQHYRCPNCGDEMLFSKGDKVIPYFRHKNVQCSYESYLHKIAKLRIKEWFDNSESIMIKYRQKAICEHSDKCSLCSFDDACTIENYDYADYDLKRSFDCCEMERRTAEGYVADLLLTSSTNPKNIMLIEIHVKHLCTEEKVTSGNKIIEFDIENEEDIDNIIGNRIEENEKTRFWGFKAEVKTAIPKHKVTKLSVFSSGKHHFEENVDCEVYFDKKARHTEVVSVFFDNGDESIFKKEKALRFCYEHNVRTYYCLLCEHYNHPATCWKWNYCTCSLNKYYDTQKQLTDSTHLGCDYFQENKKLFRKMDESGGCGFIIT